MGVRRKSAGPAGNDANTELFHAASTVSFTVAQVGAPAAGTGQGDVTGMVATFVMPARPVLVTFFAPNVTNPTVDKATFLNIVRTDTGAVIGQGAQAGGAGTSRQIRAEARLDNTDVPAGTVLTVKGQVFAAAGSGATGIMASSASSKYWLRGQLN